MEGKEYEGGGGCRGGVGGGRSWRQEEDVEEE